MGISRISTDAIQDNSITTAKTVDSIITADKIADGAISGSKLELNTITEDHIAVKSKIGYIQSKTKGVNSTNDLVGENIDIDITHAGGSDLSLDMQIPNSSTSVFHIHGEAQAHLDSPNQIARDSGAYCGLGIMRKIGSGSWVTIYRQGKWAHGNSGNIDFNFRLGIDFRDYPNTTEQVQYKLVLCSHRGGAYFGRIPDSMFPYNTYLTAIEYDTGELS